jgi:Flp pilus assembly secretin CpaC
LTRKTQGIRWVLVTAAALTLGAWPAGAAAQETGVIRLDLPIGRSYPINTTVPITKLSIASPEIADVILVGEKELVINAKAAGETDAIFWQQNGVRQHYRVSVHSPSDRMQIALAVKFAEVRRDVLRDLEASGLYKASGRAGSVAAGSGALSQGNNFRSFLPDTALFTLGSRFLTVLTDFDTKNLLVFLEAQEQLGNGRVLAEPTILAANKEDAKFLAGGQLPVPVVQGAGTGDAGNSRVTIEYKDFGVALKFNAEIISDSLIKLKVSPEVSSLDFGNAVIISGFRIPALRTRKLETTVDVRRDQSLVISGFFDTEEEKVRTGVPLLMNVPILGQLFSSTRFQRNESELVVVVTPVVIDPLKPRASDVLRFAPDTTLPAKDALKKRLPEPPAGGSPRQER